MFDPEIEAIAKCYDLFKVLEDDSKIRVLQWLISKFELNPHPAASWKTKSDETATIETVKVLPETDSNINGFAAVNGNGQEKSNSDSKAIEDFDDIAEMYAAAAPNKDWEKCLVVATYLQVKNDLQEITSFEVNKELKHLGHGVNSITHIFDTCIDRKPQLILQKRKEGKTRQAKKKYKVTGEGIKLVNSMIARTYNAS
jgi:hypothetical protein